MISISTTRQMSVVYKSEIQFENSNTSILDPKVKKKLFDMQKHLGLPSEEEIDTSLLSPEEIMKKRGEYLHLVYQKRDQVDRFLMKLKNL